MYRNSLDVTGQESIVGEVTGDLLFNPFIPFLKSSYKSLFSTRKYVLSLFPSFKTNSTSIQKIILPRHTTTRKLTNKIEPAKEFLTLEDINRIMRSGLEVPENNKSAISDIIGLGWNDIERLCWEEIEMPDKTEYCLRLKKEKNMNEVHQKEFIEDKKVKELQEENRRLRQMYMDLSLENRMLKDSIDRKSFTQYEYLINSSLQ